MDQAINSALVRTSLRSRLSGSHRALPRIVVLVAAIALCASARSFGQSDSAQQLFRTAFELYKQGEFEAAVIQFDKGLKVRPDDAKANFYVGESLRELHREREAKAFYQHCVEVAPESKESALAQERLNRIARKEQMERAMKEARSAPKLRYREISNNVIEDGLTGLTWTASDSGSDVAWNDANNWCGGKGSGWRLPSTDELLRLRDMTGTLQGKCGDEECPISPLFHLGGRWFWSSSNYREGFVDTVALGSGYRDPEDVNRNNNVRALCVHSPS